MKLETVVALSEALGLTRNEKLALVIAWMKDRLGEDLSKQISIAPRRARKV